MRHNKKINHLGRKSAHRQALLSNMASSLILHKRIDTTVAKAKALRIYVEPLITKSKDDTTHSRRVVFSYLQSKEAVTELFRNVSAKIGDRPGGYTRILRTGNRLGDNADMCMMELVDFNEAMLGTKDDSKKAKKARSRRGSGKKGKETTEPKDKKDVVKKKDKETSGDKTPVEKPTRIKASEKTTTEE
jgi:large subunit ribosomal protein L17